VHRQVDELAHDLREVAGLDESSSAPSSHGCQ
jgi:hypothetical protein